MKWPSSKHLLTPMCIITSKVIMIHLILISIVFFCEELTRLVLGIDSSKINFANCSPDPTKSTASYQTRKRDKLLAC